MARPRYTIRPQDLGFAWRWVEEKLHNPRWLGEVRTYAAEKEFRMLPMHDAEAMNRWCETWLDAKEWRRLKNAIRAGRHRMHAGSDHVNITLSRYAVSILAFWARRKGWTYSQVIENLLGSKGARPRIEGRGTRGES